MDTRDFATAAHVVTLLTLLALSAYVAIVNFWFAYDDALITYRIARNFAFGQGLVYNVGERHLGTTAPLYALLLGVLGWITGGATIPFWGGAISGLSLLLGGLALYVYGRLHGAALAGALAAMFYVTNPMLFVIFGGEMLLQMALILWAFVLYRADRIHAATVLLALATLTRGDGIFAVGVLGTYDLVVRRRVAWRAWLLFAAIVAPFALAAWAYYGSPLPGTLSAKLAQRASGGWSVFFGRGLRDWFRAYLLAGAAGPRIEFFSLDPRSLSFWAAAGVAGVLVYRWWWLLLMWVAAVTLAYRTLQVPFYHWYAAPAVVGLSAVMGCGAAGLLALARRGIGAWNAGVRNADGVLPVAAGAALVLLAGHVHLAGLRHTTRSNPGAALYEDVGRWLRDHTARDASVGYYEIGFLGYHSERRIVDSLGLIDPAVPPHVAQRDFAWAFRLHRPTYILEKLGAGDLNSFRQEPWFVEEYHEVRSFDGPDHPQRQRLILHQRIGTPRAEVSQRQSGFTRDTSVSPRAPTAERRIIRTTLSGRDDA